MSEQRIGFAVRGAFVLAAIALVYLALCEDKLRQAEIEQSYALTSD
jgi:hypothetical protein